MKSLVTMQNLSAPALADNSQYSIPATSGVLKEYMDYMTGLTDIPKEFSAEGQIKLAGDLDMSVPKAENVGESLHYFEDPEDITGKSPYKPGIRKNLPKIDLKNPMVQKVVESINTLNIGENDKDYLITLGQRESSLNPGATQGSFSGLYQFNRNSLDTVRVSPKDYRENVMKQHEAALRYKAHNLSILKNYLKYVGKSVKGIPITENGMAAAAHLLGAGTVKDFFDGTQKSSRARAGFKDALGTHILDYFKLFA